MGALFERLKPTRKQKMGENIHENFASYKWLVIPRKLKLKLAVGKS